MENSKKYCELVKQNQKIPFAENNMDIWLNYCNMSFNDVKKQELIDEIITIERYDLHNNAETDNPLDEIQEYRETLEKLPIEVLQSYIDEEITSDELYDNYISKL